MTEQITIMIVDEYTIVRQGVRTFLESQPDFNIVAEAASGEDAIRLAAECVPDVVVLDLVMPEMDGMEIIRQIKQVSVHTQIIILTSYDDDEYIFPALRAGALSYLLIDISSRELVEAVRKTARGESVLHPRIAARVVSEIHSPEQAELNLFLALSDRELEVLRLIANGYTNAMIAERLVISEKTVKGHVSNILSKLHMLDRTQAAVFAWQQGLVRRNGKLQ